ncbi:hypothetical protein ABPG74_018444 [Tetrahymena malaccensis]
MEMESIKIVNKQETQESQGIQQQTDNQNQESQCQLEKERRRRQDGEKGSSKNIDDQQQDQKEIIEKDQQKFDVLYFVGVNSIALNLLSNLYILEKLLIIIILNLSIYIALYKQKQLLKYVNNGSEIIKELYIKSKKGLDKEKILIGILIIFIISLFIANIYLQIQINKTKNTQLPIIDQKRHSLQLNTRHLLYQVEQINRMKNLKNDFIQQFNFLTSIASNLSSKVKELQNQFNYKQQIIQQLKKEIDQIQNQNKSIEQNKQEDTNQQQFYQEIIKNIQNMNNQHNQHNQQKINFQEQLKQQQNRFQKQFNQLIRDQDNQLKVYKNYFEEKLKKPIQQYRYIRPFHLNFQNQNGSTNYQEQQQKQATSNNIQQQNSNKFEQKNPQNQQQQEQQFKKEFKDSRLKFLNELFKQLDSLLKQS